MVHCTPRRSLKAYEAVYSYIDQWLVLKVRRMDAKQAKGEFYEQDRRTGSNDSQWHSTNETARQFTI